MADDVISFDGLSGAPHTIEAWDDDGQIWDNTNSVYEVMVNADWAANYAIAMTETPADSGHFVVTFPGAIPAGRHYLNVRQGVYTTRSRFDPIKRSTTVTVTST